jgi:hypothetical protein
MHKMVDGELVDLTPEKEAEIRADQSPPRNERRRITKEVIRRRVSDAGKIDQAVQMIMSNAEIFSRWTLPGRVDVYADDPDTVGMIEALGLDPAVILAE